MNNIQKKDWKEFREAGLLWFVNRLLHVFGWAIVFSYKDDEVVDVYPARVKYRGFDEATESEGFSRLTSHIGDVIDDLKKEVNDE